MLTIFENWLPSATRNICVLLVLCTCSFYLSSCSHHEEDSEGDHVETVSAKSSSSTPPEVFVTTVEKKNIPIFDEFVGRTSASQTVDIRARVEGVIEEFNFKEGDVVSKGQVLFRLGKAGFEAGLQSAKAELEKADADVTRAIQQVDVKQEKAELVKLESALTLARTDLARVHPLVAEGAIEKRQLDVALDDERRALAAVDAQKAKLTNTELNQNIQLKQANAHVSAAKAAVKQAELNLGYTLIKSPVTGIIGKVEVHPGNLVGRLENTLLATISVVNPIDLDFSVSEAAYLQYMKTTANTKVGKSNPPLQLLLADNSVYPEKGTFKLLDRAVNPHTGTIMIQAQFPNPKSLLRPGQFGRVRVLMEQHEDAVLVPQRSVQEIQGVKNVLVVDSGNKVVHKTVVLGPVYKEFFVVTSGLSGGEKVITEGLQKVTPGSVVTIAPANAKSN